MALKRQKKRNREKMKKEGRKAPTVSTLLLIKNERQTKRDTMSVIVSCSQFIGSNRITNEIKPIIRNRY